MAYNQIFRTRVVEYVLSGHTHQEASNVFQVGTTSITLWLASYKAFGTIGGNTDHYVFELWFSAMLLVQVPVGSTIVMDNASFHRKKVLSDLARAARCDLLLLPPYSPDLNPIEKTWINLKRFLRNYSSNYKNLQDTINNYFKEEWLYNRKRTHSAVGFLTPEEAEIIFYKKAA